MSTLIDKIACRIHRGFTSRLHSHNVEGTSSANPDHIDTDYLTVNKIKITRVKVTSLPKRKLPVHQSLAEIIDPRDAKRICRVVRKAFLTGQRHVTIARVNKKWTEIMEGKPAPCCIRIVPSRRSRGKFKFYAWHTSGLTAIWLTAVLFILTLQEAGFFLCAAWYVAGALALFILSFLVFQSLGADCGAAVAGALLLALLPLQKLLTAPSNVAH